MESVPAPTHFAEYMETEQNNCRNIDIEQHSLQINTLNEPQDKTIKVRRACRRSSFFVPHLEMNGEHSVEPLGDAASDNPENSNRKEPTENQIGKLNCKSNLLVTVRRSSRKPVAISRFQSTNNKSNLNRNIEFYFEPVPHQLRPILSLSAAQRAARRLSVKAVEHLRKKHVCINAEPVVIDITPRSDKIPGVIKMPDSPVPDDDEANPASCRRSILPQLETSSDDVHRSPQNSSQIPVCNLESEIRTDSNKENIAKIDDNLNQEEKTHLRMDISEVKKNEVDHKVRQISDQDESDLIKTLPTASSIDKVSVWIGMSKPLRENVNGEDSTNNNGKVNNYKDAIANRTVINFPKQHASDPIVSFCVEQPMKNKNNKHELIVGVDSSCNRIEQLSASDRKRRRSFLVANERLSTHLGHKKISKTVNENVDTVRDAFVIMKGTASPVQNVNTKLAPIFKKKSKPLECAGKAKKKMDNTSNIEKKQEVAPKRSKKLKSVNGNSTKGSNKGRRVVKPMDLITLNDDSNDGVTTNEKSPDNSQKRDANQEDNTAHGKVIPSKSSISKKARIERVDYAPFSSFGHIGLASDDENDDVPSATPHLRLWKGSSAFVDSEPPRRSLFGGSRDWLIERVKRSSDLESSTSMLTDGSENSTIVSAETMWKNKEINMSDHQKRIESLLDKLDREQWCDVMKPHSSKDFIGNEKALVMVQSWISRWKKHLEYSMQRSVSSPNQTKGMQKRKNSSLDLYGSDEEYIDDDGEVSESVLILSGPCGCGKTTLVHVIVEELQMRLVELSASEKRSANLMRSKVYGATQNYQVTVSPLMKSFNALSCLSTQPPIVLIDDADVTFGDEENFWSALTNICSDAKAPVVVTCSDAELVRRELPVTAHHVDMIPPTEEQICDYLNAILFATGRNDVPREFLRDMAKYLRYDLRACINHLQLYSTSSQQLLNSIPHEDTDEANDKNENYLHQTCYLSSISCRTRQRHLKHSAQYRTHYCGPMTKIEHEEWSEPNRLLSEEYPCIAAEAITPTHASISITRNSLFRSEYRSVDELGCDYVPYLVLIDEAWRNENAAPLSKRRLHYFDNFKSNIGGKQLINSIRSYSLPIH